MKVLCLTVNDGLFAIYWCFFLGNRTTCEALALGKQLRGNPDMKKRVLHSNPTSFMPKNAGSSVVEHYTSWYRQHPVSFVTVFLTSLTVFVANCKPPQNLCELVRAKTADCLGCRLGCRTTPAAE